MKNLLSVFFVLIFAAAATAQNDCNKLAEKLQTGDLEAAQLIADQIAATDNVHCLNLIGEMYFRKGRNGLARTHFEKARSLANDNSPEKAESLNNLGLVYWNTGNDNLAKEYVLQALHIRQALYGNQHEKTAASLNDLGLILGPSHPEAAQEYYERALRSYEKLPGDHQEKIAQSKLNIGVIYRQLKFYGDAVNHFNDALDIWQTVYPEGHANEGVVYVNLGLTNLEMGFKEDALNFYDKALAVYRRHYGEKHPDIAYLYNLIGNIHHGNEEFDEALSFYQKALIANSGDFSDTNPEANPSVENIYNSNTLLSTLYAKAQAFMDKSIYKTLKFSELEESLELLYSCDQLIDYIRIQTTNESDKIALGNSAANVYQTGALLCYIMANEAFKKDQYYEQSFYFAEKSKSAVLLEAIADAAAKSFANIPDTELEKEKQFTSDIAYYEQELAKKPGDDQEKELRDRLFKIKQQYSAFVLSLEKNYPKYFDLKFNVKVPSVAEMQKILDDETMVVSYFLTEATSRLFIYQITKDKFNVTNISQPEDFERNINGIRNAIRFQVFDLFSLTSESLYKTLFPFSIPKSVKKLVIIPSGKLGIIPFDALLTKKPKSDPEDYTSLPYLVKDYSLSYQYASALFYQKKTSTISKTTEKAVLLCAPVHFNNVPDLPATSQEVDRLDQIFVQKSLLPKKFLQSDASESTIKSTKLSTYKYLHFATHGYVDEVNPELSRLLLFEKEGSKEDGNLFSGEIYNLHLSADLVTLSACETGLGKISKGEGIIGLSRAFTYAGADNVLVSLWVVSDESTAQLMIDFYNRVQNDNYSTALREAQLQLIQYKEYSKPFYWAPFIIIGQ